MMIMMMMMMMMPLWHHSCDHSRGEWPVCVLSLRPHTQARTRTYTHRETQTQTHTIYACPPPRIITHISILLVHLSVYLSLLSYSIIIRSCFISSCLLLSLTTQHGRHTHTHTHTQTHTQKHALSLLHTHTHTQTHTHKHTHTYTHLRMNKSIYKENGTLIYKK